MDRTTIPGRCAGVAPQRRPLQPSLVVLAALACLPVAACTDAPAPPDEVLAAANRTAIVNLTLIDGTAAPALPDATVILDGDRIWWAGPRTDAPLTGVGHTLNAGGRFVMPGLIDLHQHAAGVTATAADWLRHGVTAIRDPGGDLGIRRRQRAFGDRDVPLRVFAGLLVDFPGEGGIEATRELIAQEADGGIDLVKLYLRTPMDHARAAVEEAHARGLPVTWHLGPTMSEALGLGVNGLEHLYVFRELMPDPGDTNPPTTAAAFSQIYGRWADHLRPDTDDARRLFDEMAARDIVWTPTLTLHWRIANGRAEWTSSWDEEEIAAGVSGFDAACAMVGAAHRTGAAIGAGTDTEHPADLHEELALLVRCGLEPAAALRSATSVAARALRHEGELGSVRAGLAADLLIVDANPLDDIAHAQRIWRVIQAGRILDADTLEPIDPTP